MHAWWLGGHLEVFEVTAEALPAREQLAEAAGAAERGLHGACVEGSPAMTACGPSRRCRRSGGTRGSSAARQCMGAVMVAAAAAAVEARAGLSEVSTHERSVRTAAMRFARTAGGSAWTSAARGATMCEGSAAEGPGGCGGTWTRVKSGPVRRGGSGGVLIEEPGGAMAMGWTGANG